MCQFRDKVTAPPPAKILRHRGLRLRNPDGNRAKELLVHTVLWAIFGTVWRTLLINQAQEQYYMYYWPVDCWRWQLLQYRGDYIAIQAIGSLTKLPTTLLKNYVIAFVSYTLICKHSVNADKSEMQYDTMYFLLVTAYYRIFQRISYSV